MSGRLVVVEHLENYHQLIKDEKHQITFSGMLYHRVEHLAVWQCLRAVQEGCAAEASEVTE